MTGLTERPVTRKEWREAVKKFKWDMYMATSCAQGCAFTAHKALLKFLDTEPRLKRSKFAKQYIEATGDLAHLFDAQTSIDVAIENTLARGLGSVGLKYWSKD